jgi:FtsH-binding integral membrane protein
MASSALQFAISVIGVLVFAGLTAWDTQRLKTEYLYGAMDGETTERSAIIGALSLYLNFINLFTLLLQLLGQRDGMSRRLARRSRAPARPGPFSSPSGT